MPNHPQMNELANEHGMDLHYGRKEKPAEHVHDLHYVGGENPDVYCIDIDCNKRFAPDEVMRRLNATEKLIAHLSDTLDRAEQNPPEHPECVGEEEWWKQRTRMALAALEKE